MACLIDMLDLRIGNSGLTFRTPVDDAGASVNIALLVQAQENLLHRLGTALIKSKTFALPVSGRAHLLELFDNPGTVFLTPLPCALEELLSAEVFLGQAFFLELLDDLDLCRDARVVRARLPECFISLHSLVADQDILHRIVERMSHMQLSGDIRRRHDDSERFLIPIDFGMEIIVLHPVIVNTILYLLRIVCLTHFHHVLLLYLTYCITRFLLVQVLLAECAVFIH